MTDATPDEGVLDFVDRYLAFVTDGDDEPDLDALEEPLRSQALQQLRVLDLLDDGASYAMPPIEDDPIARRFGWDRLDETVTISSAALKDAAATAGLRFTELAAKLTASGWPTEARDLLRLTNGASATIDRDLAARFAAILRTSVPNLEASRHGSTTMTLDDFLVLEEAREIIESFARELGESFDEVERSVRGVLATAAFRNQTNDAWRDALRAALERVRHERSR